MSIGQLLLRRRRRRRRRCLADSALHDAGKGSDGRRLSRRIAQALRLLKETAVDGADTADGDIAAAAAVADDGDGDADGGADGVDGDVEGDQDYGAESSCGWLLRGLRQYCHQSTQSRRLSSLAPLALSN